MQRIVLLYAPPWKLARTGEPRYEGAEGPPAGGPFEQSLRGDSEHIPLGLLSLAAQAKASGHDVQVVNLFAFAWSDIEKIIASMQADLFGLSCFTLNRRGTAMLAGLIRRLHPHAHITAGGPHASVLPREMLAHCSAINTVVIGEGEQTFMELLERISSGSGTHGIAGTAWRSNEGPVIAETPAPIDDLNRLVPLSRYFDDHIVLCARGCPWNCSFCASSAIWGRGRRAHSAGYILDMLAELIHTHGLSAIAFKDETFTADRARVLDLCRSLHDRGLNIVWSCDTRADVLDAELLTAMRASGCRRISLGVESADEAILKQLNKNISPAAVRETTRLAHSVGISVRYYMIVGSPGETMASLQRSRDFVHDAGASEVIFNPFTLLPGTHDWERAVQSGEVTAEIFFTENFLELQPLNRDFGPDVAQMRTFLQANSGVQQIRRFNADECRAFVRLFPDRADALLDLADALLREGDAAAAELVAAQALAMNHPQPGLCRNLLACCALRQGRVQQALELLLAAAECGCHNVIQLNLEKTREWAIHGGPKSGRTPEFSSDTTFEISRPRRQPIGPGELTLAGYTYKPIL
jgi:anaerobic magnesium-protoporphyrin IX monomethyl ester cyclase